MLKHIPMLSFLALTIVTLTGLPPIKANKLRLVKNAAGRILTCIRSYETSFIMSPSGYLFPLELIIKVIASLEIVIVILQHLHTSLNAGYFPN